MNNTNNNNVTGIILAGGKAKRMGGQDKGLLEINGITMISYVIRALEPQVASILINANRNIEIYEKYGYPVFTDNLNDYQGPLAGIAVAMHKCTTPYICTCPCDGPLIADDLVSRLYNSTKNRNAEIAVAHDGRRIQPVYALIQCDLLESLNEYLNSGERKIDRWFEQHKLIEVDFSDNKDCFINVNTPEDKNSLAKLLVK